MTSGEQAPSAKTFFLFQKQQVPDLMSSEADEYRGTTVLRNSSDAIFPIPGLLSSVEIISDSLSCSSYDLVYQPNCHQPGSSSGSIICGQC